MPRTQILLLVLYAAGMAAGQTLFKLSSMSLSSSASANGNLLGKITQLSLNPAFISAIVLYMALSVLWVKILSFIALSRAYPFTALAFAFTAIISAVFFREMINRSTILGMAFIMVGLLFISRA